MGLALGLVLRMLYAVAWQCDDAYITHRTAWNLVHGHGLTWNAGERVQAFTHPLWLGASVLCHLAFGEVFFSLLVLSAALVLAALFLVARLARRAAVGGIVAALLSASAAFVDFGVSGLENPLLYVLLVAAVPLADRAPDHRRLVGLGLLVSALYLTRPDAPLFVLPLVLVGWWTTPGRLRGLGALALGAVPLLVWQAFSLVWFGALVPNTALAKLNLGVPRSELVLQGLRYLGDAVSRDALALLLAGAGAALALAVGTAALRALAVGLVAYLAYVVWIGGDFMSLRFVAAPAVLGAALLARLAPPVEQRVVALLAGAAVLAGLLAPGSRWLDDGTYGDTWPLSERLRPHHLEDERAFYAPASRAAHVLANWEELSARGRPIPPFESAIEGARLRAEGGGIVAVRMAGYLCYFAGPTLYAVDRYALTDPFLARIPFTLPASGRWRPGHYERALPEGYPAMAATGRASFEDPSVNAAFDAVALVTRGPLWAPERWRAIWELHTGVHDRAFATLASGVEPQPWPVE